MREDLIPVSVDPEKRSCLFLKLTHDRFQFSEMAGNLLFEGPRMAKLEWRFDDQKMGKVGLYCAPPSPTLTHPLTSCAMAPMLATGLYIADAPSFLDHWFSGLNTPAVDKFVCKTMRDSCPDVWAANGLNGLGECEAKLAALPLSEGDDFYLDGNTCALTPR